MKWFLMTVLVTETMEQLSLKTLVTVGKLPAKLQP